MGKFEIEKLEPVFGSPACYPPAGTHPRLYLTKNSIARVRRDLRHPDHRAAYEKMISLSEVSLSLDTAAFDGEVMDVIRAKALRALLLEEEKFADEAIGAVLFYLRGLEVSVAHDACRAFGALMHAAACVYDWCFDKLSGDEREEIVYLCETNLGPHFEVGYPPVMQGNFTGHGCEAQILRDWLSLGIAAYDEHPDIFELIGGRIFRKIVPVHDFYYKCGSHWQGSSYGPYRYSFDLTGEALFLAMTDGEFHLYSADMEEAMTTFLSYFRADGEFFRIGDDPHDKGARYLRGRVHIDALLAGYIYKNPMYRAYAYEKEIPADFDAVLTLDDPAVGFAPVTVPNVRYCGSPLGQYIIRTKSGASAYMKIGESLSLNHEHKDAGDFMLFYKGSLASASNCYEYTDREGTVYRYGSPLDLGYNKQTISHNCVLVFDPDEDCFWIWKNSGGQKVDRANTREVDDLEAWLRSDAYHRAKVTAHADALTEDGDFSFAYIAGDLSNAYSDKVTAYERRMLAVRGDTAHPLYFFVYDDLTVKNPAFRKTFLLHVTDEPQIDGARVYAHSEKGGRLDMTTLLPKKSTVNAGGGGDDLFLVGGERLGKSRDKTVPCVREDGWGRIEVSPAENGEKVEFLHTFVCKNDDADEIPAEKTDFQDGVCAVLSDVACVIFREVSEKVTLPDLPASVRRVFLLGLPAGEYEVDGKNHTVAAGENMLYIEK